MMVFGLRINYDGPFADLPVLQAGPYKVIAVRRYTVTPAGLGMAFIDAEKQGAQFLVIDPKPVKGNEVGFIDIQDAKRIAA